MCVCGGMERPVERPLLFVCVCVYTRGVAGCRGVLSSQRQVCLMPHIAAVCLLGAGLVGEKRKLRTHHASAVAVPPLAAPCRTMPCPMPSCVPCTCRLCCWMTTWSWCCSTRWARWPRRAWGQARARGRSAGKLCCLLRQYAPHHDLSWTRSRGYIVVRPSVVWSPRGCTLCRTVRMCAGHAVPQACSQARQGQRLPRRGGAQRG